MTVERRFTVFNMAKVLFDRVVTSDHIRDAFAGIAYMFEAIGNEPVPNSGAQVIAGHDHAEQGGSPITRGGVAAQFCGRSPLFSSIPTSQRLLMELGSSPARLVQGNPSADVLGCTLVQYASPGIDTQLNQVNWEMRLRVYWPKSAGFSCRLRFENPDVTPLQPWLKAPNLNSVEVDVEGLDEIQELTVVLPVKGDWWNQLNIYIEALGGDAPYTESFSIYDYQIHETQETSQPVSAGVTRFA